MPRRLPQFLQKFIAMESASGVVMLVFFALALIMANSPLDGVYESFIHAKIGFSFNGAFVGEALLEWVKDVLMVLFFLIVAMELKMEVREGFLSKPGQVRLPLLAALGGVVMPSLIFLAFNHNHPENVAGWAVPSATDIAFALCVLVLAGKHVPPSAKIFLLAIAIFDDLMAIVIIALFYSGGLALAPLGLAVVGVAILFALNRAGVEKLWPYITTGVFLWFCFHYSGIHTTIAGVLTGMAIPLGAPLKKCIRALHGWVSFGVLPLFAFTTAGINFAGMSTEMLLSPLPLGIALGLFFGKQAGIFGAVWLQVKLKLATLPEGMKWGHVYAVSLVAGIGFTMSLFIGLLAFKGPDLQHMVKAGVIGGSFLSAVCGYVVLRLLKNR